MNSFPPSFVLYFFRANQSATPSSMIDWMQHPAGAVDQLVGIGGDKHVGVHHRSSVWPKRRHGRPQDAVPPLARSLVCKIRHAIPVAVWRRRAANRIDIEMMPTLQPPFMIHLL